MNIVFDRNVIYALSLDGASHRYVGQTTIGMTTRLAGHRYAAKMGVKYPVYSWMRKHGPENIQATQLEVCSPEALDSAEIRWIARLREEGYPLLNATLGGVGIRLTDECIARRTASLKNTLSNPEMRAKISETQRLSWQDPERRAKHSAAYRRSWSDPVVRAERAMKIAHGRWHVPQNKRNPACALCVTASAL